MADLHTEKQLLSGFYDLEAGAWRWTAQDFRVVLKVPADASQKGAYLTLQGTVTEGALQNGPVEIAAALQGVPLAGESFSKAGEMIYRAEIPSAVLRSSSLLADFHVNRTFRAPGDKRDLGVIASVISIRSK
jgi:hypothetical protein